MRTNLEKWNYYLSIINDKTNEFIDSETNGKIIPEVYYYVYPVGKIAERRIQGFSYAHFVHNGKIYFSGIKPTKKDVEEIAEYAQKEIPFSVNNIYCNYIEDYGANSKSTSAVSYINLVNQTGLYYSLLDAESVSRKVLEDNRMDMEFKERHKKDSKYNYTENGYKFLGWQNGWKHVYYDQDGNLCSETGKPPRMCHYAKEDYPEYWNCIDSKHRRIEVRHNSRGSENTVSCPICKIYWKYDCSD